MPWDNSNRRNELPRNWKQLRQACKEAAGGQCQAIRQDGLRCPTPGNEAHHPNRNNHTHLIWLCPFHHQIATQQQAAAARRPINERYPKPKHPGLA